MVQPRPEEVFRQEGRDADSAAARLVGTNGGCDDAVQGHGDGALEEGLRPLECPLDESWQGGPIGIDVIPDGRDVHLDGDPCVSTRQLGDLPAVKAGYGADGPRVVLLAEQSCLLSEPVPTPGLAVDGNCHVGGVLADQ